MILNIYPFKNGIDFEESQINTLEIRNTKLFYNISRSFVMCSENLEGVEQIRLYDKSGKELSLVKNSIIINNIFDININDKKIMTKLYESISKNFQDDIELTEKISINYSRLIGEFSDVFNSYDLDFEYSVDFNIKNFLKMICLEFSEERVDFSRNLYSLIDVVSEFNLYSLIIFNNLKSYLSDDELQEFYKYCKYKKSNVLFVEPMSNRALLEYETRLIIDEDFDDYIEKL